MNGGTSAPPLTRALSSGLKEAVAPIWRELSSSFSALGLQRKVEDETTPPDGPFTRLDARTPLTIPTTSLFDRNPQIVVGVLLKYVGLGWRPRLFVLQDGVLKYYKVYGPTAVNVSQILDALRQQGEVFPIGAEVSLLENQDARTAPSPGVRDALSSFSSPFAAVAIPPARMEIHMQVGSVRESNADGRKFYVHSGTTILTLRAETQDDRWVWEQALSAAKDSWSGLSPAVAGALSRDPIPAAVTSISDSQHAAKLAEVKSQLTQHGATSTAVEYVTSTLEQYHQQYVDLATIEQSKRQALLEVIYKLENEKRQLETALAVEGMRGGSGAGRHEADGGMSTASGGGDADQQSVGDDAEGCAVEAEEAATRGEAEEDEFFECEALSIHSRSGSLTDLVGLVDLASSSAAAAAVGVEVGVSPSSTALPLPPPPPRENGNEQQQPTSVSTSLSTTLSTSATAIAATEWLLEEGPAPPRRDRLPPPQQREKSISLWSLIKEMVGKDLTRVCLPVYFNEPLSALQKSAEELEYSELLDAAASFPPRSVERMVRVAAFAVSAYSSTEGRTAKPFNPLLGETYELVHVEKGFRFIAEKVSHHPTIIAAAAEGRGWRLEADADVKSRFWGRSIELKPEGVLRLTFTGDGDVYAWNKVTTSINNLILGKIYIDHGGIMRIRNLTQDGSSTGLTARIRFKETSMLFDKDPRQVRGFLEKDGRRLERPLLYGHWDDALNAEMGDGTSVQLWKKAAPPPDPTRYNLTAFAIWLNEVTAGLREKVAPTDCRLRPDQAFTEKGMWDEANVEKQRLEHKQRAARSAADAGEPLKPRWFDILPAASAGKHRDPNELAFSYKGGYWEARAQGDWAGCRDIFGQ